MDDATATEVEAALIDAYPGLMNLVAGTGSGDCGVMHAKKVIARYSVDETNFSAIRALLLSINRTAEDAPSQYEATRRTWRLRREKAERADVIPATRSGIIDAAFQADRWVPAIVEYFPRDEPMPGRWGFPGRPASDALQRRFVGKRVPDRFRRQGASNPVKYSW